MFNPKHLTKLTNDALARLEEERVAEEERIRQIAEDLKHAEEVKKAQEIKEALHRRNLIRHINKGLQTAIESALLGDKTATLNVPIDVADDLTQHFQNRNFMVVSLDEEVSISKINKRFQSFLDKVSQSSSPDAAYYKTKLTSIINTDEDRDHGIRSLVEEMNSDAYSYFDDAILYFNFHIKPLLDEGEFDSSDEEINHQSLRLSWKSKDTTAYKFQHIEEAPFWLASSSGIGLIQEINKCLTTVANAGSNTASFALEILPQITDRWGSNEMTKVTFDSKPIGVFPFTHEVFVQLITKLGFSATIKSDSEKTKLQISW